MRGVAAHTFNPGTQETGKGISELETSLVYKERPSHKRKPRNPTEGGKKSVPVCYGVKLGLVGNQGKRPQGWPGRTQGGEDT